MITIDKINVILPLLEDAKLEFIASSGGVRANTREIVEDLVGRVWEKLHHVGGGLLIARGDIYEAWLVQAVEQVAAAKGLQPLPPRDASDA